MIAKSLIVILLVLTFLLILLGGVVHGTGSSLACPDWPLCYGSLFPQMRGAVAIEHSHRLTATTVGLLTVSLAVLLWKSNKLRWWGIGAVVLVLVQGLLGGITVLFKLPTLVSTAHLATSMLFFSLLVMIAIKIFRDAAQPLNPHPLLTLTLLLTYLQIVLGALVRHSGAGLVCPEIPFCYGSIWPEAAITRLHMTHRIGGLVVIGLIFTTTKFQWNRVSRSGRLGLVTVCLLVLGQIGLGVLSVETLLGLPAVTAHLAVATLLLGSLVSLWGGTG